MIALLRQQLRQVLQAQQCLMMPLWLRWALQEGELAERGPQQVVHSRETHVKPAQHWMQQVLQQMTRQNSLAVVALLRQQLREVLQAQQCLMMPLWLR
jgi:hypothetical protein